MTTAVFWDFDQKGHLAKFRRKKKFRFAVCMIQDCSNFSHDKRRLCKGHRSKIDLGEELKREIAPNINLDISIHETDHGLFWKKDRDGKICKYKNGNGEYPYAHKICAAKGCTSTAKGMPITYCKIHQRQSKTEQVNDEIPPLDLPSDKIIPPVGLIPVF